MVSAAQFEYSTDGQWSRAGSVERWLHDQLVSMFRAQVDGEFLGLDSSEVRFDETRPLKVFKFAMLVPRSDEMMRDAGWVRLDDWRTVGFDVELFPKLTRLARWARERRNRWNRKDRDLDRWDDE